MPPTRYELRIKGRLSPELRHEFEEFEIREAPVETVLLGEVVDSAHLDGVLARARAFGLHVVALRSVPK